MIFIEFCDLTKCPSNSKLAFRNKRNLLNVVRFISWYTCMTFYFQVVGVFSITKPLLIVACPNMGYGGARAVGIRSRGPPDRVSPVSQLSPGALTGKHLVEQQKSYRKIVTISSKYFSLAPDRYSVTNAPGGSRCTQQHIHTQMHRRTVVTISQLTPRLFYAHASFNNADVTLVCSPNMYER